MSTSLNALTKDKTIAKTPDNITFPLPFTNNISRHKISELNKTNVETGAEILDRVESKSSQTDQPYNLNVKHKLIFMT